MLGLGSENDLAPHHRIPVNARQAARACVRMIGMDGYNVNTEELQAAADAIRRSATDVERMADYCQSLGANGGAFGALLQSFRDGYDAASTTQIRVLDNMRYKLKETAEAVDDARRAYKSKEQDVADELNSLLAQLEPASLDSTAGGGNQ